MKRGQECFIVRDGNGHALAYAAAAQSLGIEIEVADAPAPDRLENAFATITAARAGALIVLGDAMFFGQYPRVVAFTAASHLPALFPEKQPVEGGGLMAYGPSIPASFRRAGAYVDKILRGANPAGRAREIAGGGSPPTSPSCRSC
jgi:putative ABC transport system substrate-binding protein